MLFIPFPIHDNYLGTVQVGNGGFNIDFQWKRIL